MTSLFTNHDKYHIHKILGFGCLSHYAYRIYNKFIYGDMLFNPSSITTYITPAVHLTLSLSSFIFHIPTNRFNSKAIIWKELQLHNIIFTSRSVFMMYHTLLFTPNTSFYYYSRLVMVASHHLIADYVTNKYQIEDKTTTRDIPYDTNNKTIQNINKKYYAISQLLALIATLISTSYENGFMIMFPIQLSTFLMTLVRKNIISNNYWHLFYGLSLSLPYFMNSSKIHTGNSDFSLSVFFIVSRLVLKIDKYLNMLNLTFLYLYLNN